VSTGSGTFPQTFPPGSYTLTTTAYSHINGQGSVVASAVTTVNIEVGKSTTQNVSADLDSPVAKLVIDGDPIAAKAPIDLLITGHAEDAAGNTILLPVGALTWDVGAGGSYGTINALTGVFSPYYPGTAYIRLREKGAGKSTQVKVTITANATARLYFSDNENNRIIRATTITGTGWKAFTWKNSCGCEHQVAVDNRAGIYWPCSDSKLHYIANFDSPVEVTLGSLGSGYGCFNHPKGVATDRLNRIYVVDTGNNRVIRMNDISGAGWTEVGRYGSGDGELNNPTGICVSPDFEVYVADTGNHRIVRFVDMASSGWDILGGYGSGLWQFNSPKGVAVYRTGIFITDTGNHRIVNVTDIRGSGWTTFGTLGTGTNQFNTPTGITCDISGNIYINDTGNYRTVRITSMTGTSWAVFGTQGSGTNQFNRAYGICAK
jgi:hypothetical protein